MSVSIEGRDSADTRVMAGDRLILRVSAYDPSGIGRIFVQCYQFSMASTNRVKLAVGELVVSPEEIFSRNSFEVAIDIPHNAAIGKWGVQMIEFTSGRGYKTAFYRGQSKFDDVVFEVISPPARQDALLRFNGIDIAGPKGRR